MKPTVFNERVATALKSWHHTAKKQIKHGRTSESTTPFSSRPTTPTHGSSPIHLLRNAPHKRSRSVDESFANSMSPRNSDFDSWDPESQHETAETSNHRSRFGEEKSEKKFVSSSSVELPPGSGQIRTQHELNIFRFINDAALVHFSIRDLSPEALFSQCKTMEILDSKTMEIHGKLLKCGFLSLGLFAMSGFESLRKMC